ncbi:hypothetical protein EI94DRAFT_1806527 [Lactarius quietus]|nr:hypothetical protein EI94DRAFT_1806527 [Lactarius quietus]
MNRSEDPRLTQFSYIDVELNGYDIVLRVSQKHRSHTAFSIVLTGPSPGWEVPHLFQMLDQFSTMLSNAHHLSIESNGTTPEGYLTELNWVQLLSPFPILQSLHARGRSNANLVLVLNRGEYGYGEMAAGLLPVLELLCIEGQTISSVSRFCTIHRRTGHPVTFCEIPTELYEKLKSYA